MLSTIPYPGMTGLIWNWDWLCEIHVYVCVHYLLCVLGTLCSNLWSKGFRLYARRNGRNIHVAHSATALETHHHHLVCAIIVIDGRVSFCCSSPLCQLYTSGNEIHVLHVKRNFVSVGQGSFLSLTRAFLQCGRQQTVGSVKTK